MLVFIHGGYFTWGSSSRVIDGVAVYDGAELAARGDVVVVTLSYRLGALGFVGHPDLAAESEPGASGNDGLLDQLAISTAALFASPPDLEPDTESDELDDGPVAQLGGAGERLGGVGAL